MSPGAVAHQVAARLAPLTDPTPLTGHGPHPIPFDAPQFATWLEPPGRSDPRTPDTWTFTLEGPAQTTLTLNPGLVAELRCADAAPHSRPLQRLTESWTGPLEPGSYRVDTTSLGRNDRLDYTLTLHTTELQPGPARTVTLPSTSQFTLATARVVSLTTFGTIPIKAVLRQADGTELERVTGRADGWDLALSRLLPAGAYRLELTEAAAPTGDTTPQNPGATTPDDDSPKPAEDDANPSGPDRADAPMGSAQAEQTPTEPNQASADDQKTTTGPAVELTLALPLSLDPIPAPSSTAALEGQGVHILTLPQPAPGTLLTAQAEGEAALVLSLERQTPQGWRVVAQDQSRTPLVAALADTDPSAWRLQAWSVDGGPAPIRLAARALDAPPQTTGLALEAIPGFPRPLAAARITLDGLTVRALTRDLLAVTQPGAPATRAEGQVAPQSPMLWLLGTAPGSLTLEPLTITPGTPRSVSIPPHGTATLAAAPGRGVMLWRAESGLGQPGFPGGGIAIGSALALPGATTTLHNAGGAGPLPVLATLYDLTPLPEQPFTPGFAVTLPPRSALPVRLPGAMTLTAILAPGNALLSDAASAWTGTVPLTRTLPTTETLLLVNVGGSPAPVSLAGPEDTPEPLQPGTVTKRFYGAAGSFERRVTGGQIAVAGDATLIWQGDDGQVRRARTIAAEGPGRVIVTHGPGAVILSVTGPGASPWPDAAPQAVALPQRLPLEGPAMALTFTASTPLLLHATTTAPVFLSLGGPPELFAAGAELHRALPPGPVTLRAYAPQDGPLSGTLLLSAEPIRPIREGLGDAVVTAPGGSAAFGFTLTEAATVGVGIRAEPDRAEMRLLTAAGAIVGEGVAQLRPLAAGRYVIEARVPPDAPATTIRPAVIGITPQRHGPPPDIAQT